MDRIPAILPENLKNILKGTRKVKYNGVNLPVDCIIDTPSIMLKYYLTTNKKKMRLHSEVLKKKYNKEYNHIINFLQDYGIIKLDKDYYNGGGKNGQCRTYKLTEETLESKRERVYLTYSCLINKYKDFYSKKFIKSKNYKYISSKVMDHVIYNLNRVDLSYDSAKDYLDSIQNKLTENQYDKNLISLDNLKNLFIYISFDNYGRCHTNFTTLKSKIRDTFLMIDGEKTKTMDISNSQPLFLSFLLSKNKALLKKTEYNLFKQLVIDGKLYQYVYTNRIIKNIVGDPFNTKAKIKEATYVVLFGKNSTNQSNQYTSEQNILFQHLFPTIFNFIKIYKNGNHKKLAYELQRSESNFLFNNICEEAITKYPDIPFFTVHDSITVKESDYDKVNNIFEKHITRIHNKIK